MGFGRADACGEWINEMEEFAGSKRIYPFGVARKHGAYDVLVIEHCVCEGRFKWDQLPRSVTADVMRLTPTGSQNGLSKRPSKSKSFAPRLGATIEEVSQFENIEIG